MLCRKCFSPKNIVLHMLSCDNMCFHKLSCLIMSYHVLSCLIMAFTCYHVITCVFCPFWLSSHHPLNFVAFHWKFLWLSSHHRTATCDKHTWLSSHLFPTQRKTKKNNQIQGWSSYRLTWGACPLSNPPPFRDGAPID